MSCSCPPMRAPNSISAPLRSRQWLAATGVPASSRSTRPFTEGDLRVKMVIFGLSVSSSWGNGHATLWRGLIRALSRRGWTVTFFERDVPYYAGARDLDRLEGGQLVLYADW